jgi:ribosomal protein S18 acetylase RimI-like enzyme
LVHIREALAGEMAEVGELRVTAYQAGGFLSSDSGYASELRNLGADGGDLVLVAIEPAGTSEERHRQIAGTVMLQFWPRSAEVAAGPDEAEIRALAVRPGLQGTGLGRKLLDCVIDRARQAGIAQLVLCTMPQMRAAHRLYEQAGFIRLPDRDVSPVPDLTLLVYGLRLA